MPTANRHWWAPPRLPSLAAGARRSPLGPSNSTSNSDRTVNRSAPVVRWCAPWLAPFPRLYHSTLSTLPAPCSAPYRTEPRHQSTSPAASQTDGLLPTFTFTSLNLLWLLPTIHTQDSANFAPFAAGNGFFRATSGFFPPIVLISAHTLERIY